MAPSGGVRKLILTPAVRAGISTYATMPARELDRGLQMLTADLDDRSWHNRHRDLLDKDELDLGYRIIIAS